MKKVLQQGFSFVELMIATLLGVILLLGVMQVLISSSTLGTTSNNLSVNQDSARTVLELLGGEAQRAGYKGCGPGGVLTNSTDNNWQLTAPIMPIFSNGFIGIRFTYGLDEGVAGTTQTKLVDESTNLPITDCVGKELYYRSYSYSNCTDENGKEGLCIRGYSKPEGLTANGDLVSNEFIEGVSIDRVEFNVKMDDDKFKEVSLNKEGYKLDELPPPTYAKTDFSSESSIGVTDLSSVSLVTFYISVKTVEPNAAASSDNRIERRYSASYPLKNLGSE